MNQEEIESFLLTHKGKFSVEKLATIMEELSRLQPEFSKHVLLKKYKSVDTTLLLAWLVGYFGIDRFFLKQTGSGILKLFLFFIFFISNLLSIYYAEVSPNNLSVAYWICFILHGIFGPVVLIWWIIDGINAQKRVQAFNFKMFTSALWGQ